ncbi:MAG: AAA family ATPase [Myxococcaceae bacterium]|nr:AAA family ATPase [Myxococcaceae bacterium]MBH2006371.1 AAA family ATPase [Myxococcaceae bacterium]
MNNLKLHTITFLLLATASRAQYYDYAYSQYAQDILSANTTESYHSERLKAYQRVVFQGLLPLAIGYGTYRLHKTLFCRNPLPPQAPLRNPLPIGGFAFFLTSVFSGLIQRTLEPYAQELQEPVSGFMQCIRNLILRPSDQTLTSLELRYIEKKPFLTPEAQNTLISHFLSLRTNYRPVFSAGLEANKDREIKTIEQLLDLPTQTRSISINESEFQNTFQDYEPMGTGIAFSELKRFCRMMELSSHHQNPRLKNALYLHGPPGVGKTEVARKLAATLKMPLIKVNLGEIREIGDFKGVACEFASDTRCHPGLLAHQIIRQAREGYPYQNMLLFFDEADHTLNRIREEESHELVSLMLNLLEGKTSSLENPFFRASIDVGHLGFILAGNRLLRSSALNNRLNLIEFGNYSLQYRIKAGRDIFLLEALKPYQNLINLDNFTSSDFENIDNIAKREHKLLEMSGTDPGFRGQRQQIERYVYTKAQNICD